LLLTGVAVSNVFDDNLELDSGGKVTVRELGQMGKEKFVDCGGNVVVKGKTLHG